MATPRVWPAILGWESLNENINSHRFQRLINGEHKYISLPTITYNFILWIWYWPNRKALLICLVVSYAIISSSTSRTLLSHTPNQTHSIFRCPILCQFNHLEGSLWLPFCIPLHITPVTSSPSVPCLLLYLFWLPVWRLPQEGRADTTASSYWVHSIFNPHNGLVRQPLELSPSSRRKEWGSEPSRLYSRPRLTPST